MNLLRVGLSGTLPAGHASSDLAARASTEGAPSLPPMLKRERKVRVIVEAAARVAPPSHSGFILVTRFDGRPANLVDPASGAVRSFGDLSPSTVAMSLVPHMAASCVLHLHRLRGPALSLTSRDGLAAAMPIARRWLSHAVEHVLVVESDLALPTGLRGAEVLTEDYALAVLYGRHGGLDS